MFASWGRLVHRRRGVVLSISVVLLVASLAVLSQGGVLHSYQTPRNTESGEAEALLKEQIPAANEAQFIVVLSHPTLRWSDPAFRASALAALEPLRDDARVSEITTPYDAPAQAAGSLVSLDGHRIAAIVAMDAELTEARDQYPSLRAKLDSPTLQIHATDIVAIYAEIQAVLDEDLVRSESIGLPISLVLLLVVFGSVVAALLPLGVGMLAVAGGMAGTLLASRFVDVSIYAVNIVTLIGLGVAIDYSLFMVSRFREELARGLSTEDALAETMATAGRATTFSGLTVAIGLSGLAFFRGLYFASMGMAGAIVVGLAVVYALTFLPALLSYLGPRIDRLRLPIRMPKRERNLWERIARGVMRRPILVLIPTLALIVVAGLPFLGLTMGSAGVEALPEGAESRVGLELLQEEFPGGTRNPITIVVEYPGAPLTGARLGALYDYTRELRALPGVTSVESVVDLDPRMGKDDYVAMYDQPRGSLPGPIQDTLNRSVGASVVTVRVITDRDAATEEAREVVAAVRDVPAPADGRALATGPSATDADTIDLIYRAMPVAIAFIVVTTYLLLLVQTGSIVLPAKAIVMNVLSIAASFGALVWIFQEGNLSAVLGFTPAPIDPSLPVLLFCLVFGLSMDYEVLLLSRMHEEYERTGDNTQAVAAGLAKSGRLITSAAAIMIAVFGAFAFAHVTIIKAVGLGLALAILIDATLVRALVVPATMRLMGKWNWWAPTSIHRLWKMFG